MRARTLAALLLLVSGTAHAMQRPEIPPLSDDEIKASMKDGEEIESRVDGDINGDGDIDTAYIIRSDETRWLYVQFAARGEFDMYHELAGSFELDVYPQGNAEMTISKGVLIVKDLTGGTTATMATYRYRGEKTQPKVRLIGLDVTVYSRTYAHDGSDMSWNVLTGDVITTRFKVRGTGDDVGYDKGEIRRFKRPVKAYYMDDTPNADATLDDAMAGK